ncbi:amidase signature enzyme [Sporormia fimetaria CBS 119925]|uniref:Amidase signature enzyme n=1 Tax=Sporormia fimetaria CBS 119925 TaxID=1340428 RepID=A0A6A6VG65_9PLEO|nr:amidase signature enzyme [Sporormia fimetaria CBS 119925]
MRAKISFTFIALTSLRLTACQQMPFDAREATIDSVHHALFSGLTTCRDVVSSFLARIEALNDRTNAIITLNPRALDQADVLDESLAAGNATGALFCVPVLLKDNFDTADMPTTAGSLALRNLRPTQDAPSVTALKNAGAVILGKANLHELALEGLSVSSLGGQTINPYDATRTPGGSSGGTGAAVAASFCVFGTGTDTVNSLRSPASANSLFSIRPTRGLVTTSGVVPVSYTQDTIGPIGRSVKDVAVALTVMASTGYDPTYNYSALIPPSMRDIDFAASLTTGTLKDLRLGVLKGFFSTSNSSEVTPVNTAMTTILQTLSSSGATLIPIDEEIYNATAIGAALDVQQYEIRELMDAYLQDPSRVGDIPRTYTDIYTRKSSTNESNNDFLVIPAQYSYVHTALTNSTSSETYIHRQHAIQNLSLSLASTFTRNNLDFLIYPEQKNLVVKLGSPSQAGRNGILAALTGSPVVALPAGFSEPTEEAPVGVPIGMEILGRPWSDEALLKTAWQIEQLMKVRRAPEWALESVEVKEYNAVPEVVPDRGNVDGVYPLGSLGV